MSSAARTRRRALALTFATVLTASLAFASTPPASAAQTIGFPTFSGPAVPQPPVGYSTGNMMQAIYNAESGGTDFWIDRLLARTGIDPSDADGGILMSRGRALFMKMHTPGTLGFAGQVAYIESISNNNAFAVAVTPGTFTEQASQRRQTPSHWRSVHTCGSITVDPEQVHHPEQRGRGQPVHHQQRRRVDHAAAAGHLAVRHLGQRQRADRSVQLVQQPDHDLPAPVRRRLHRHQRRAEPVGHRRRRRRP